MFAPFINDKIAQIYLLEIVSSNSIKPYVFGKPLNGSFTNSEDPDEMQHNAAFHQDLHCLQS